MGSMTRIQQILLGQRSAAPNRGRFLADHEMDRCLHLIFMVATFDLFLDESDPEHLTEKPDMKLTGISGTASEESSDAFAFVPVLDHCCYLATRLYRARPLPCYLGSLVIIRDGSTTHESGK